MLNQESLVDDITRRAQDGTLSEAHGRARELYRILEVLSRRNRKNVLLVGYTGVGKRRIVEGLALAGMQGETEELLGEFRIVELNLALLVQGSEQHEKALASLIKHLRQTRDIILFIPDIDLILGPNSAELGETNLGTLLRPTLIRGDITCIGATTPGRYRELIEPDSAARRAFEAVEIQPMTEAQAYDVICAVRPEIEAHHHVEISDETIRAAVVLSERYIKHHFLPGKAIDVLDRASSRYRLKKLAKERKPELVDDASLVMLKDRVSPHDVRKAIENVVGFEIRASYAPKYWEDITASFRRRMTGQSAAINEGIHALRKAFDSLSDSSGPKCVLLLVGPARSGKQFWAETLAEVHLGRSDRCFEIDLGTATESNLVELLETAAGWGIDAPSRSDSTGMTNLPESVIYVTGIDAPSREASERFRRILEGTVLRSDGRPISLHNCIVVIASEKEAALPNRDEYKDSPKSWRVGLRQQYPPEILNRVDAIIPLFPLELRHHYAIMHNDVNVLRRNLARSGITIVVQRDAYEHLSEEVRERGGGVVELRKALFSKLIRPIERLIEDGATRANGAVRVDLRDNELVCEFDAVNVDSKRPPEDIAD